MSAIRREGHSEALTEHALIEEGLLDPEIARPPHCALAAPCEQKHILDDEIQCLRYQWFIASAAPDGPASGPHSFSRIYWAAKDGDIHRETRLGYVLESELEELSPVQVTRLARGLTYVAAATVRALPIGAASDTQNPRGATAVRLLTTLLVTCGLSRPRGMMQSNGANASLHPQDGLGS